MPWVNAILAKGCSKEEQEKIKAEMAKILNEVLGKDERGLTVTFQVADGFFRAGQACLDGAVVEIKYIGQFPAAKKQDLARRTADLLNKVLGLSLQKISVPFSELSSENWGGKLGDFK